jgi:hypothetical protein
MTAAGHGPRRACGSSATSRAGEAFLRRMGVLGDWVVDFAFGDVHTRPGLTAASAS